jgi:hypothetical protein
MALYDWATRTLPSLNYPGSSSSGALMTGSQLGAGSPDYPVYDTSSGRYISKNTGRAWTGKDPNSGRTFKNGMVDTSASDAGLVQVPGSTKMINPNDPSQRYQAVDIVKSPTVAADTQTLLDTFKTQAADSLKGFDEYKKQYSAAAQSAFDAGKAATNIDPLAATLRQQQATYSSALTGAGQDYASLNAQDAAAQRAIVDQANAILPQYDAAAQAIGDRQLQAMQAQLSKYKMGSGTPTSLGSNEERILARNVADVQLPLEQARIQRQYDLLQNLALPVQRDIYGHEVSRVASFNPQMAGQQYSSGQSTELQIQNLRNQVSGMSFQNATQYMQSLGVPWTVQQQILSGQAGTLGQLGQLEDQSRYRGLQDVLGVNVSQPQYYSQSTGGYPGGQRNYSPNYATVPTGAPGSSTSGTGTGGTVNPATSELYGGRYDNMTWDQIMARNRATNASYGGGGYGGGSFYSPGEGTYSYGNEPGYYPQTDAAGNAVYNQYQQFYS